MGLLRLQKLVSLRLFSRGFHAAKLESRGLIALKGPDSASFLQGLVTNDVMNLDSENLPTTTYSLMLNVQGRVFCDFLISNVFGKYYLMETDSSLINEVLNIFKRYKLRRKIEFTDVSAGNAIYALWNFKSPTLEAVQFSDESFTLLDPRFPNCSQRLYLNRSELENCFNNLEVSTKEKAELVDKSSWEKWRYQCGVPEGVHDLPPGKCLPLESNCDFLNGVSFTKGCYIGQELTARTHNIGVTRKRLLPVKFDRNIVDLSHSNLLTAEINGKDKPAGKIRSISDNVAFGLVRLQYFNVETRKAELFLTDSSGNKLCKGLATWPETFPDIKAVIQNIA